MSYSVIQDSLLTQNIKEEMTKCADYYKKEDDFINFAERYLNNTLYIEKLKSTLVSKFPRDESETVLWRFIRDSIGYYAEETDNLLSIPSVSKAQQLSLPNLNTPVSLSSSMMLPSDISSLLFNSGKFPSASSMLGLPDPMAHSTLAANNMFLSTNLFKMQELLKPLSTSSPLSSSKSSSSGGSSKATISENKHSIKIPSDIKNYSTKINDFMPPDLKKTTDFLASDLSISSKMMKEFTVPDLMSASSKMMMTNPDYTINFAKKFIEMGEKLPKIPKTDFSMLNLSVGNKSRDSFNETPTDLTVGEAMVEDKPLNLAAEFTTSADQNVEQQQN